MQKIFSTPVSNQSPSHTFAMSHRNCILKDIGKYEIICFAFEELGQAGHCLSGADLFFYITNGDHFIKTSPFNLYKEIISCL